MCLAIPGKIVSIDDSVPEMKMARVDFGGVTRNVCLAWIDAGQEDYVLVHAGMAIAVIDAAEAAETWRLLEKLTEEPKEGAGQIDGDNKPVLL